LARDNTWLRPFGRPTGFGWMAQDLNAAGALGNAAAASADIGIACAEHGADAFIQLLREIAGFDLATLAAPSRTDGPPPT
jgi:creatinine amidohydrolase